MTDTIQASCAHYVPSLRERFFRKLGFRYHLGEEPEGTDGLPGWSCTDSHLHFGIADRLRLLLTGKLFVSTKMHSDVPSAMVVKTRLDWRIVEPGGHW